MKKLLYITADSKPENLSTCKTVGRQFVNSFLKENTDFTSEELDLYSEYIPEVNYKIFTGRAKLVSGPEYSALSLEDRRAVDAVNSLCDQFLKADTYVIAAPMWSVSFPSVLKKYIDCIIIDDKVIKVYSDTVKGLLDNKERNMIYIQSSGGVYPKIFSGNFNHGVDYFHDIFKFLGINKFEKILVEGVDDPSVGREKAISSANKDIDNVLAKLSGKTLLKR